MEYDVIVRPHDAEHNRWGGVACARRGRERALERTLRNACNPSGSARNELNEFLYASEHLLQPSYRSDVSFGLPYFALKGETLQVTTGIVTATFLCPYVHASRARYMSYTKARTQASQFTGELR